MSLREIQKIIKEWKDEAGVKNVIQISKYLINGDTLKICTDLPGFMIGKRGELVDKYRKRLQEIEPHIQHIEFIEVDRWYIK